MTLTANGFNNNENSKNNDNVIIATIDIIK